MKKENIFIKADSFANFKKNLVSAIEKNVSLVIENVGIITTIVQRNKAGSRCYGFTDFETNQEKLVTVKRIYDYVWKAVKAKAENATIIEKVLDWLGEISKNLTAEKQYEKSFSLSLFSGYSQFELCAIVDRMRKDITDEGFISRKAEDSNNKVKRLASLLRCSISHDMFTLYVTVPKDKVSDGAKNTAEKISNGAGDSKITAVHKKD